MGGSVIILHLLVYSFVHYSVITKAYKQFYCLSLSKVHLYRYRLSSLLILLVRLTDWGNPLNWYTCTSVCMVLTQKQASDGW